MEFCQWRRKKSQTIRRRDIYISALLYVITFPQLLLSKIDALVKQRLIQNHSSSEKSNISLFFFSFLRLSYFASLYNFHLIYIFKFFLLSHCSWKSYVLIFSCINFVYSTVYYLMGIFSSKSLYEYIETYLKFSVDVLNFLLSFIGFVISLGDMHMLKRTISHDNESLSIHLADFALNIFELLVQILLNLLLILHLANPISMLRINSIRHAKRTYITKIIISAIAIFTVDVWLLALLIFNLFFGFRPFIQYLSFTKYLWNYIQHSSSAQNLNSCAPSCAFEDTISHDTGIFSDCQAYQFFKNTIILHTFYSNLKFLFIMILLCVSLLFPWRLDISIKSIITYAKDSDHAMITIVECLLNILNGVLELISPIYYVFNYLFYWNYLSIERMRPIMKAESWAMLQITFFVIKHADMAVTIISFARLCSIFFFAFLLRKPDHRGDLFPLVKDEHGCILQYTDSKMVSIEEIRDIYYCRRIKLLKFTCNDIKDCGLYMLSLSSFLDPFCVVRNIRNVFILFNNSMYNYRLPFQTIKDRVKTLQLKLCVSMVYDLFIFIPSCAVLCIISPWNLLYLMQHMLKNCIVTPIKHIQRYDHRNDKTLGLLICKLQNKDLYSQVFSKNKKFLNFLWKKFPQDWSFILKLILIHLALFRAVFFWIDYSWLCIYKENRRNLFHAAKGPRGSIYKSGKVITGDISKFYKGEFKIQNNLLETYDDCGNPKPPFRRFSISTIKFVTESSFKLFRQNVHKHFSHIGKEISFYPILIVITVITPWNVNIQEYRSFFREATFFAKWSKLKGLLMIFICDILAIISTLFLLFSVMKTIDTVILIYYSVKKAYFKDELYYNLYYKSNFKGQIYEMMRSLVSSLVILGMILLNIILLSRLIQLCVRIKFYLNNKIMDDIWKFKHMVKLHHRKRSNETNIARKFQVNDNHITAISSFLKPSEIVVLSSVNSYYLSTLNTNHIWKNCFENFYMKRLDPEIAKYVNPLEFDNYKSLCFQISQYITHKVEFDENERDKLIGPVQVLMEETIESFLNIPHLILLPFKLAATVPFLIRTKLQEKIMDRVYSSVILKEFRYMKFPHEVITRYLNFTRLDSEFFNLQIIGFVCLIDIKMIIIEILLNLIFYLTVKCVIKLTGNQSSRQKLMSQKGAKLSIVEKLSSQSCFQIERQAMCLIMFIIFHFAILTVPSIVYNYHYIYGIYDDECNKYLDTTNSAFYLINGLNILDHWHVAQIFLMRMWRIFRKQNLIQLFFLLIGPKLMNIPLICFNLFYIKQIYRSFKRSNVFIYDCIFFIFSPNGLLIYTMLNFKQILTCLLFPHSLLKLKLKKYIQSCANDSLLLAKILLLKFISMVLYIFPVIMFVAVRMSLSRIITISLYSMLNVIILKSI